MASYRVFKFRNPDPDVAATGDHIRVVKDEFAFLALAFPMVWLLCYRLWLALAVFFVLSIAIVLVGASVGLVAAWLLNTLIGFYFAIEGTNWIAAKLRYNGFDEVDVVTASNREAAEARALNRIMVADKSKIGGPSSPMPWGLPARKPRTVPANPVVGGFPARITPLKGDG